MIVDSHAELRGNHDVVAVLRERTTQELLALGAAVNIGRIE
jgi:hypothetical protein